MALRNDPAYRKRFREMWYHDKKGLSLARIKRWLRIMDDRSVPWIASVDVEHVVADLGPDRCVPPNHVRERRALEVGDF